MTKLEEAERFHDSDGNPCTLGSGARKGILDIRAQGAAVIDESTCSTEVNKVECPWCGAANNWQDLLTDGCLEDGRREDCDSCGKEIVIDAVDWQPIIWCKKGKVEPMARSVRK